MLEAKTVKYKDSFREDYLLYCISCSINIDDILCNRVQSVYGLEKTPNKIISQTYYYR